MPQINANQIASFALKAFMAAQPLLNAAKPFLKAAITPNPSFTRTSPTTHFGRLSNTAQSTAQLASTVFGMAQKYRASQPGKAESGHRPGSADKRYNFDTNRRVSPQRASQELFSNIATDLELTAREVKKVVQDTSALLAKPNQRLISAAKHGSSELHTALLDGADINYASKKSGDTAAHKLLRANASPQAFVALMLAVDNHGNRADLMVKNKSGVSVLELLLAKPEHMEAYVEKHLEQLRPPLQVRGWASGLQTLQQVAQRHGTTNLLQYLTQGAYAR